MHEYGVACEILRVALDEASRHGASRVTRVEVRAGVLRSIVPEQLSFLFAHAARGTAAEGAELAVVLEPLTVTCGACGDLEVASFALACPRCGGPLTAARGGEALTIAAVTIE